MYWLKNSRLNIYIRCHSHQYYLIKCLILFLCSDGRSSTDDAFSFDSCSQGLPSEILVKWSRNPVLWTCFWHLFHWIQIQYYWRNFKSFHERGRVELLATEEHNLSNFLLLHQFWVDQSRAASFCLADCENVEEPAWESGPSTISFQTDQGPLQLSVF